MAGLGGRRLRHLSPVGSGRPPESLHPLPGAQPLCVRGPVQRRRPAPGYRRRRRESGVVGIRRRQEKGTGQKTMMKQRLTRELAYNVWANRQAWQSLSAAKTVPPRAAEVLNHIVGAEWHWLGRLGHPNPGLPVWPAMPLAECGAQLRALSAAWQAFLAGVTEESLGREVAYTNTKGERWANTVADILTHVVLHSAYHRGQVATLLGRAGEAAAYSDYIECVRRGHLDGEWPA